MARPSLWTTSGPAAGWRVRFRLGQYTLKEQVNLLADQFPWLLSTRDWFGFGQNFRSAAPCGPLLTGEGILVRVNCFRYAILMDAGRAAQEP